MIVAHLSDLHLRNEDDAVEFAHQLDCVGDRGPDHLVITGDLLDRWDPDLLDHALDLLAARELLDRERLTIIHGNHDFASSGGHPQRRSDLWRLIGRFWDPPPLIAARKREFYRRIALRAPGVALQPASAKIAMCGVRFAAIDSIPAFWLPVSLGRRVVTLRHGEGAIPQAQLEWLSQQRGSTPLIVLVHHYPLPVGSFRWDAGRTLHLPDALMPYIRRWQLVVRMEIDVENRARFWEAIEQAGASAILCGHVHRARLERHGRVAVGLNGQSGAAWAGRTIAYYRVDGSQVSVEHESASRVA